MKKNIVILLLFGMCLSGCGKSPAPSSSDIKDSVPPSENSTMSSGSSILSSGSDTSGNWWSDEGSMNEPGGKQYEGTPIEGEYGTFMLSPEGVYVDADNLMEMSLAHDKDPVATIKVPVNYNMDAEIYDENGEKVMDVYDQYGDFMVVSELNKDIDLSAHPMGFLRINNIGNGSMGDAEISCETFPGFRAPTDEELKVNSVDISVDVKEMETGGRRWLYFYDPQYDDDDRTVTVFTRTDDGDAVKVTYTSEMVGLMTLEETAESLIGIITVLG